MLDQEREVWGQNAQARRERSVTAQRLPDRTRRSLDRQLIEQVPVAAEARR